MKKVYSILLSIVCLFPVAAHAQVDVSDTTYYVMVTYNGSTAAVEMTSDVKDYVTVAVNGADVTITSTATSAINEITYGLAGSTSDGSFTLVGTYKATMELFGVNITNPTGPAIDIQNGKRIELSCKKGTESTLTDGTSTDEDAWKAALQCKGHLEFKGKGSLNVYGNYKHGIWSKEYMEVKNCTINVLSAVKDAINCNYYFSMESGLINLSGFGDDGIQVSIKTEDTDADNTGNFTLTGGTINIDMKDATGESIKAEGTKTVATEATLNVSNVTAIDEVTNSNKQCKKVLRNGQVQLLHENKKYSLIGNEIQ
ncbi:MAG: carbohydrate-binding domain-containing protein [Paludibacteraceae bacterium]|nr:carbohydrate-binding domain-containing protein [Paludibacteraceae bacterium]